MKNDQIEDLNSDMENDPGTYEICYWGRNEKFCEKRLFALNGYDALSNFTLPYRGILIRVTKVTIQS